MEHVVKLLPGVQNKTELDFCRWKYFKQNSVGCWSSNHKRIFERSMGSRPLLKMVRPGTIWTFGKTRNIWTFGKTRNIWTFEYLVKPGTFFSNSFLQFTTPSIFNTLLAKWTCFDIFIGCILTYTMADLTFCLWMLKIYNCVRVIHLDPWNWRLIYLLKVLRVYIIFGRFPFKIFLELLSNSGR